MRRIFTILVFLVVLLPFSFGQQPKSINEDVAQIEKVYPNPVSTHVYVEISLQEFSNVTFEMIDILGVPVKKWKVVQFFPGSHKSKLDLSSLRNGIYLLKINVNGKVFVKRIKKN